MKKIIKKITLISVILTLALSIFSLNTYANNIDDYLPAPGVKPLPKTPVPESPYQDPQIINVRYSGEATDTSSQIENPTTSTARTVEEFSKISNAQIRAVRQLPNVSIEGLAATAIKTFLGWSMFIALVGIVSAGIYMLIFEGDSTKIEKAKNFLKYLIIGAIVVSVAYGIVTGIMQFTFF